MSLKPLQKQASFLIAVLVIHTAVYTYFGLGNLITFSFLEPELMNNSRFAAGHTSQSMRWMHFLTWLPANLSGIYACLVAIYLCILSRSGLFFTTKFAKGLMHVGVAILISGLTDIAATSLVPHILSSLNPAGQLPIRFIFSPEEIGLVLCGIGFVAVGQMMLEATRLSDENKSFV